MDSRGFELAISTIVVMILGVLIVGGGIFLVQKITSSTQGITKDLTADQEAQLAQQLRQGQLVAISPPAQEYTGKTLTFGVAVENRLSDDTTFDIDAKVLDAQGQEPTGWKHTNLHSLVVKKDAMGKALIAIDAPSGVAGTYILLVNVTYDTKPYDARFATIRVG